MFHFGLFSTIFPYLLLGIFYSLFLVTFTFGRINHEHSGSTLSENNASMHVDVQKISLQQTFQCNISAIKDKAHAYKLFQAEAFINFKPVITDCLYSGFFFSKLFPNPPPQLS